MKLELNKKISILSLSMFGLFFAGFVKAVCPVCVVAVGAGLGLSRWLGVDDAVSSLWIGAILLALVLWTLDWMKKKNWKFALDWLVVFLVYYGLTVIPMYYYGIIGHPLNAIFGIDKIAFGIILGTVVFLCSVWLHGYLKVKNNGKQFFIYQKVVVPVTVLIITSLVLFLLLKYKII